MSRVYNFSAGPAVLPEEVLKEVAEEMMDYQGTGMSVMEMSHRSADFQKIIDEAEQDLRDLMKIPDNYKVLFLQGGASQQFAAIPMNLMKNKVADYIVTGQWAKKAYQEAQKYGKANKIASSEDKTFSYIPDCSDLPISPDADYVYICENNTIYGTKFKKLPNTKGKTLVADVSSCFLSEPVDVSKYGIIYSGVQKNIGPAGMVISIIREDLITDDVLEGTQIYSLYFYGDAPEMSENMFRGRALTAYYPKNNPTWTKDKLQSYGGTWITWSAWDPESRDIYGADLKSYGELSLRYTTMPYTGAAQKMKVYVKDKSYHGDFGDQFLDEGLDY